MSSKELEIELFKNIDEYVKNIRDCADNTNTFIKETRHAWTKWSKKQKKKKHPHKHQIHLAPADYIPENCLIPPNPVLLL